VRDGVAHRCFSTRGDTGKLSRRPLVRTDAADMLKRRLKQAGLPAHYSPHSFRATGITNFLENDGTLEAAQRIAGHADSRTTKLYDRRGQKVLVEDMERIRFNSIPVIIYKPRKRGVFEFHLESKCDPIGLLG
jgi:integrase